MSFRYSIKNDRSDALRVWVEPFCQQFTVPAGSTLTLLYDLSEDADIEVELSSEQLTVYPNARYAPDAEIDGKAVDPDMQ